MLLSRPVLVSSLSQGIVAPDRHQFDWMLLRNSGESAMQIAHLRRMSWVQCALNGMTCSHLQCASKVLFNSSKGNKWRGDRTEREKWQNTDREDIKW